MSRLRWKKVLPFDGVQLSLSPALDQSLKRLRAKCFTPTLAPSLKKFCGEEFYTPLTFQYVLSDLIHRGGAPSALMAPSFLGLPPVFRKSIEANKAWSEQRPVWCVKVLVPFTSLEQELYDRVYNVSTPMLRLVLMPIDYFYSCVLDNASQQSAFHDFLNLNSTCNYFVDNIEVDLKLKSCGLIAQVEVSFLLEDRRLLDTHCAIIIDQANCVPVMPIGLFSDRKTEVNLFRHPYPWSNSASSTPNITTSRQLVAVSCNESQVDYNIRLKVNAKDQPLSGNPKDYRRSDIF